MREFEGKANRTASIKHHQYRGKFVFLDNDRYDIPNSKVTILGSPLFSFPPIQDRDYVDAFYLSRDAAEH